VRVLDATHLEETLSPSSYVSRREALVHLVYSRSSQSDLTQSHYFRYRLQYDVEDLSGLVLYSDALMISYESGNYVYESENHHDLPLSGNISESSGFVINITSVSSEVSTDLITWTNVSVPSTSSLLPSDIHLEIDISTEKYTVLSDDIGAIKYDSVSQDLVWLYLEGSESFDVEWVFIDELSSHPDFSSLPEESPFLFKSGTRINSSHQRYHMDMAYPDGVLYFRYRSVGRFITGVNGDYSYHKHGNWNYWTSTNVNTPVSIYRITPQNQFEPDKNWLYQVNFAEEGKSKSVISYHDGSLRNRQTVSYSTSDAVTLIAEQKYDYEGRSSVSVLPAPKPGYDLKYSPNFNMIQDAQTGSLEIFNKEHFDGISTTAPLASPNVSTTYGAAQYFSANNTLNTDLYRDAIPDAQGYVYSEVEYMRDGTGRVQKSSGIGSDFSMGSGREMSYHYGTTNEVELRRLFGKEVGSSSHYKKNLVIDPNGQASVSYHDQEGRTIATGLIGESPDNLLELSGAQQSHITASLNSNNVLDAQQRYARRFI